MNASPETPEPWLRGTLMEVSAVPRAVLHALELAGEDLKRWGASLTDAEFNAQPSGLPSVAFQIRHIARSIDRLLTYAEGNGLSGEQTRGITARIAAGCVGPVRVRRTFGGARARRSTRPHPGEIRSGTVAIGGQESAANDAGWVARSRRRPHTTSRWSSHHHGEDSSRRKTLSDKFSR